MNLFFEEYFRIIKEKENGKRFTRNDWKKIGFEGFAALCYFAGYPKHLPMDDLHHYFKYKEFPKNRELVTIGKPSTSLYYIIHGKVKIVSIDPNGNKRVYALFNDGSAVTSIPSFFFNGQSSFAIIASSDLKALEINKDDYKRLCTDKIYFEGVQQFVIAKRLSYQLQFDKLHYLTAKEKMAKLYELFPAIFLNFYDKEIAELLGIGKETFSRVKKQLGINRRQ